MQLNKFRRPIRKLRFYQELPLLPLAPTLTNAQKPYLTLASVCYTQTQV